MKNGSTTRLTSDEGYYNPCFSGDGKLIFYDSGLDGGCLGAVNLETGDINRDLTWDAAGEPTWGPSE
ncbi:hypothetical protein KAU45_01455 [bacterium]|nr:hypothetical protein [bacterium]